MADIGRYLFVYFGRWLPTSLHVKQQSSRCNLAISSRVSLVASLRARCMEAEFDATEGRRLYKELAGRLLRLACGPAVFVFMLVDVFVFVPRLYQLPPKLAANVQSSMSFKS